MAVFDSEMKALGGENDKKLKGGTRENETRREKAIGEMRKKKKRDHVLTICFFLLMNFSLVK